MKLPAFEPQLLPEGHYKFRVSEEPEVRKNENGKIFVVFKFIASDGILTRKYRDVFAPWEERYRNLLLALGGKKDPDGRVHLEGDFIGKMFEADIIHVVDPKDPTKTRDKIANIMIFDDVPVSEKIDDDDIPF